MQNYHFEVFMNIMQQWQSNKNNYQGEDILDENAQPEEIIFCKSLPFNWYCNVFMKKKEKTEMAHSHHC